MQNVGPNWVETMCVLNDAAEKRIEGESLTYFFFLLQEQFMKSDMRFLGIWIAL